MARPAMWIMVLVAPLLLADSYVNWWRRRTGGREPRCGVHANKPQKYIYPHTAHTYTPLPAHTCSLVLTHMHTDKHACIHA
jgi:hypothetical protein